MARTQAQPDVPAFVEALLARAVEARASDLYLLPARDVIQVRWRVGGRQEPLDDIPRPFGEQCLTHVKVLAGLLTYRTQIAQDGVIRRDRDGQRAELRVATMPTLFGERITIRLLDHQVAPRHLEDLAFPEAAVEALRRMLARPFGLVVLTGPTGCGKTTTIYAMVRELIRLRQDPASIITLEDPIESVLDGVSQAPVTREKDDWNYPVALRAALRQDVKTLVVGEMRDPGVVNMVLDAALTGHRIITTYHAGDIAAVYARMLHQGFEPFLIASAVTGVVSQRLIAGPDGHLHPVVATLEADDPWRDFIASFPSLADLRRKVAEYPGASLAAAAAELHQQGLIPETDYLRIKHE